MSVVIPFPKRTAPAIAVADECEIDIFSAVDLAIRDLREISEIANEVGRARARECLAMLENAYAVALEG
ncbi:MAG: hypothetical protein CFE29_24985 [Bradyrhizobiaceae bacterium PARB1]|nr:MAG: hypothetical protein CFE29_24985 [Bradyrhizobiaceae bacterium PARB1]